MAKQDTTLTINKVTMSGLCAAFAACAAADVTLIVLGPPGTGKTQSVRQWAAAQKRSYCEGNAMLMLPEDVSGVLFPGVRDSKGDITPLSTGERAKGTAVTVSLRPAFLPTEPNSVLCLDDFTNAAPAMQQVFYQLALERRAGTHALPEGTFVVMFGNRPEDKSGAITVNPVLANRCVVVEYAGPSWDEWDSWAEGQGVHPDVRAFLAVKPDYLNKFSGVNTCNATPRSWHAASRLLSRCDDSVAKELLAGAVGSDAALKLISFRDLGQTVPRYEEILSNPKSAAMPPKDRLDALYFCVGMIATRTDVSDFDKVWQYAKRMDPEMRTLVIQIAQRRLKGELFRSKAFAEVMADKELRMSLMGE